MNWPQNFDYPRKQDLPGCNIYTMNWKKKSIDTNSVSIFCNKCGMQWGNDWDVPNGHWDRPCDHLRPDISADQDNQPKFVPCGGKWIKFETTQHQDHDKELERQFTLIFVSRFKEIITNLRDENARLKEENSKLLEMIYKPGGLGFDMAKTQFELGILNSSTPEQN